MPRRREELAVGEWAVLALIAEGESRGFAIARAMAPEGEVGKVWSSAVRWSIARSTRSPPWSSCARRARWRARPARSAPSCRRRRAASGRSRAGCASRWSTCATRARCSCSSCSSSPAARPTSRRCSPPSASASRRSPRGWRPRPRRPRTSTALVLWRLESTTAAVRFVEAMLAEPARSR